MYFYPLNFIRFILAIGVVLYHYGVNYYPFNQPGLKTLIVNSSFRVSFFFFISGFVMSLVYARQAKELTATYFYKRRFSRIFPVYWLAFIITIALIVFLNHAFPRGFNIVLHTLGLQSLYPGHALDLNFTTWSISVELVFYLVFPFLLRWMMTLSLRGLIIASITIWFLQSLQHILFVNYLYDGTKPIQEFIDAFPVWHLPTFFAGMVAARLIALNAFGRWFTENAIIFFITSLAVLVCIVYIPNPIAPYIHNGLLSPVFMLLVVSLFYDTSFVNTSLSHKQVSSLGDVSYGLFIFQYPVWIICSKLANERFAKTGWFFLVYFICLVLAAALINRFFEKPILKWLRRENKRSV